MGIVDKIFNKFGLEVSKKTYSGSQILMQDRGWENGGSSSNHGLTEYEGAAGWVAICVNKRVNDIKSRPFYFTNLEGKELDIKKVPENIRFPFEVGFNGMTFSEQLGALSANRTLGGNGYFWIAKGNAYGKLKGLDSFINFPCDKVKMNLNSTGLSILNYELSLDDGSKIKVPPEEIIHSRTGMVRRFLGIGIVRQIRLTIEGDIAGSNYYRSFLEEAEKMPLKHINLKDYSGTQDDLDRNKAMMAAQYSVRMMLSTGDTSIMDSKLMSSDFNFLDSRKFGREEIISATGLNHFVLGLQNGSGQEKSGNQIIIYHAQTINPELHFIEQDITNQFVKPRNPNILFKLRKYPTGAIENIIEAVKYGFISPNTASEMLGYPVDLKDEARNTIYIDSSLIPIKNAGILPTASATPAVEGPKPGKSLCDDWEKIFNKVMKSNSKPKPHQVAYMKASIKSRVAIEDKYTIKIAALFDGQKARVLKAVEVHYSQKSDKQNNTVKLIFDLEYEDKLIKDEVRGMHTSGVQKGVSDVAGIAGARVNHNISNPFILRAINKIGENVTRINETTRESLKSVVAKAFEENWHVQKLQDEIAGKFSEFSGYRSRMIARTEASIAWDYGAQIAYTQLGVKTVDIVGCEDNVGNCNRKGIPVGELDSTEFHPNHTGVAVPSEEILLAA